MTIPEALSYIPATLWVVFAFIIGLLFGSFANVVIYRLPKGKSIVNPPSFCPSCQRRLAAIELIPVISWLLLRTRCRSCKTKISSRYPIAELMCGALFASMAYFTPTLSAIMLCIFAFILLVVSFIDWDTQEIPDGLLITGTITGVLWVALGHFLPELFPHAPLWHNALLGAVAGAIPLLVIDRISIWILKKDGFGYGDVKLMAMIGLFLGWQLTLGVFFFAFVSGGMFATYLLLRRKAKRGEYMAFGPFLCAGAVLVFWLGEWLFSRLV